MLILTINTGSSSIRLAAFEKKENGFNRIAVLHEKSNSSKPEQVLSNFIKGQKLERPSAVVHRVVHGGEKFKDSILISEETEKEIDALSGLAPLHNPVALKWIRSSRSFFNNQIPQIAVFDTAFYANLPEIAKIYALPFDLYAKYGIRRYGFHGIAHKAMLQKWQSFRPDLEKGGKVISLQLGSGCSITAVKNGEPIDTSMGFSPLEGLIMSTRSGDIDPGILIYLQKSAGYTSEMLNDMLNEKSGILGISQISKDMKTLTASKEPNARLAVDIYCYRIKKYIGAYLAALNGADCILFGGGIGENSTVIREKILENMEWCGIELDKEKNNNAIGTETQINSKSSKINIRISPVDESAIMAQEALGLIKA